MAAIDLFPDVLDPRVARQALAAGREWFAAGAFSRTSADWQPAIVRASPPVLIRDFGGPIGAALLAMLHRRAIIASSAYGLMLYAWPHGSYIAWRRDSRHADAVTIYLNETWDADWGGLFLYEDEDRDGGAVRAVSSRASTWGCATARSCATRPPRLPPTRPSRALRCNCFRWPGKARAPGRRHRDGPAMIREFARP